MIGYTRGSQCPHYAKLLEWGRVQSRRSGQHRVRLTTRFVTLLQLYKLKELARRVVL